jgi:hypothetical protein
MAKEAEKNQVEEGASVCSCVCLCVCEVWMCVDGEGGEI